MTPLFESTTSADPVLIYGAGGFGRELAWLAESATSPRAVACFIDDAGAAGRTVLELPVLSLVDAAKAFPRASFVVAAGSPAAREAMTERALAAGLRPATLVHRNVEMSRHVAIGEGSVICAGCIITVNVSIADHVQVNLDCTIGHDAILEPYATLAPGVHVSGWVRIARGAYVGTGACIINGTADAPLVIGPEAVIGAGAVVTKSIAPGVTAVGIPARAR